jgi:Mg2+-importing ATPase
LLESLMFALALAVVLTPELLSMIVTVTLARSAMTLFGPVSSVFDFLTFYALIAVFGAGAALFQTGWFMESMATQVLVVFAIRTRRLFFRSRPNGFLVAMALAVVAIAIAPPLFPSGHWLGFVALPPLFFAYLSGATFAYLALVEFVKVIFYRTMAERLPQVHYGQF